jgi:hypothetical protein
VDERERHHEQERREVFAERFEALALPVRAFATGLVGLPEDDAARRTARAGYVFRVARRDGTSLTMTADLRSDRIDATVAQGVVVDVDVY